MRNQTPPSHGAAAEVFGALMAPGSGPRDIERDSELLKQFRAASLLCQRRLGQRNGGFGTDRP